MKVEDESFTINSSTRSATVNCDRGMVATGGGFQLTSSQGLSRITGSMPTAAGTGWTFSALVNGGGSNSITGTVYVICVSGAAGGGSSSSTGFSGGAEQPGEDDQGEDDGGSYKDKAPATPQPSGTPGR
ncbi:hypothetical protein ACFFOP_16050 [Sinosporangium siamense]|uniref:hypothetical protein n=1 Tax=Sinosporangium siamense TaxID=1367973 RepID=UPI0035EF186F